jgi:hypothetical protein
MIEHPKILSVLLGCRNLRVPHHGYTDNCPERTDCDFLMSDWGIENILSF